MRRSEPARQGIWGGAMLALTLSLLVLPGARAAGKPVVDEAKVSVDGAGFFRDRELRAALIRVLGVESVATLNANAIEDAAVILASALGEQGFQKPVIEIELVLTDGSKTQFQFDPTFEKPLPRPLEAREVRFE